MEFSSTVPVETSQWNDCYIPPTVPNFINWVTTTVASLPESFPIQIRKVSNGFVMKMNGEEFVFNEMKDLLQKIKELK